MIKINIAIGVLLDLRAELIAIVKDNVFAVGIPDAGEDGEKVTYPVVTYSRSLSPEASKTCVSDEAIITVDIWSRDYKQSVEIAEEVRLALEGKSGIYAGQSIQSITLTSVNEGFELPMFYSQVLVFNVK